MRTTKRNSKCLSWLQILQLSSTPHRKLVRCRANCTGVCHTPWKGSPSSRQCYRLVLIYRIGFETLGREVERTHVFGGFWRFGGRTCYVHLPVTIANLGLCQGFQPWRKILNGCIMQQSTQQMDELVSSVNRV